MAGRMKIALALGGGAARGLAHIGVLKVLEEERVPIDLICGTSIGALVGGLYATLQDSREMEKRFLAFSSSPEFKRSRFDFLKESQEASSGLFYNLKTLFKKGVFYGVSVTKTSFISAEHFEHNINSLLEDIDIGETRIPFAAVAGCLGMGREVVLRRGSLRQAVSASCAVPGVLPPVDLDGRSLIDGGWLSRVPVLPALRLGARGVIAVDISPELEDTQGFRKGYDIMVRANAIRSEAFKVLQCRFADVLIEPPVGHIHWADFSAVPECVRLGEEAAREAMPRIRALLWKRRWTAFFDPFRQGKLDRFLRPPPDMKGRGPEGGG